jgi:hypothetical protein
MTNVSIKLQSTVGDFTPEFMRKLPLVEADMRAHGLEPSEFVISKDRGAPPAFPLMDPFFYDYTVFVGDDSFTVTEPNDMSFLAFFHKRCIPKSEDEEGRRLTLRGSNLGPFRRFLRWMSQPIGGRSVGSDE